MKGFKKLLALATAAVVMSLVGVTPAMAAAAPAAMGISPAVQAASVPVSAAAALDFQAYGDTGGGAGGGGGGGSFEGDTLWKDIYDPNGAWGHFLNSPHFGASHERVISRVAEAGARGGTPNLVDLCAKSTTIWYRAQQGGSSSWLYNADGYSTSSGAIRQAVHVVGDPPAVWKDLMARFIDSRSWPTSSPAVLICSAAIGEERAPETRTTNETRNRTEKAVETFNQPYSHAVAVNRQITSNGIDPIGVDNLHDQPAVFKKTAFAAVYDRNAKSKISVADLRAQVATALAQDALAFKPEVTFDEKNTAGFAEGGVLNVSSFTRTAVLTSEATTVIHERRDCTERRDWNVATQSFGGWYATNGCGGWSETGRSTSYSNSGTLAIAKLTGFYQTLSVHCNPDQLAALLAADPSLIVIKKEANGATVLATPTATAVPFKLTLGDARNANASLAASAKVDFYTKECTWECVAYPVPEAGASTANGALTNVRNSGDLIPGSLYGATYEKSNGNNFEMFRDNQARPITLDVWYPASAPGLTYKGQAPVSTTIAAWGKSTPTPNSNLVGDQLTVTGKTATKTVPIFPNADGKAVTAPGLVRTLNLAAPWASEQDRPVVLNVGWTYQPLVDVIIPTSVGFGGRNEPVTPGFATVQTPTKGTCVAQFGTEKGHRNPAGLVFGGSKLEDVQVNGVAEQGASNLVTRFIRSVAN